MRILIVGAGGIGCYYGARLQSSGNKVVFVARGDHLNALQQNGLQVQHSEIQFNQMVNAVDEQRLLTAFKVEDFDLIIICFKAFDTASWLTRMREWLKTGSTPILSLQNGVDNEPLIAKVIGKERTFGGLAVRIGGHIIQPGIVSADGPAQVVMGAWPNQQENQHKSDQLMRVQEHFLAANIPTRISDNIELELWRKLLINNGVNPLSAITGLTTRALVESEHYEPCVRQLMQEVVLVANQEGVHLTQNDIEEMLSLLKSFDAIKTSMLVDHEKGKPIELDAICGSLLMRAKTHGLSLPANQMVFALLS